MGGEASGEDGAEHGHADHGAELAVVLFSPAATPARLDGSACTIIPGSGASASPQPAPAAASSP